VANLKKEMNRKRQVKALLIGLICTVLIHYTFGFSGNGKGGFDFDAFLFTAILVAVLVGAIFLLDQKP
jgi:hypothetical protein